jgi:rhamnulokinase
LVQARAWGEVGSLGELRAIVARSSEMKTFEPWKKTAAAWAEARSRFAAVIAR